MANPRKPSTRALAALPPPARLRDLVRGLAMLDAILQSDWESRYYSFDPKWGDGESLGSMRNGQGDWFFALFPASGGAAIRGFDHESPMSPFRGKEEAPWEGLFDGLPEAFAEVPSMGGFPAEEITFLAWNTGSAWQMGPVLFPEDEPDPDGSERLWELLDDDPASYVRFAGEYHEVDLPLAAVEAVYRGEPLTKELVLRLSPDADLEAVTKEAEEIGYPMAAKTPAKSTPKKTAEKVESAAPPAAPAAPAAAKPAAPPIRGQASFKVAVLGPTVQMLVHDKPVIEFTGDGDVFYNELFDLVKAKIKERKKKAGG